MSPLIGVEQVTCLPVIVDIVELSVIIQIQFCLFVLILYGTVNNFSVML